MVGGQVINGALIGPTDKLGRDGLRGGYFFHHKWLGAVHHLIGSAGGGMDPMNDGAHKLPLVAQRRVEPLAFVLLR